MKVFVWSLVGVVYLLLFVGVVLTVLTTDNVMAGLPFAILGLVMLVTGVATASTHVQMWRRRRRALREIDRLIKDDLFLRNGRD